MQRFIRLRINLRNLRLSQDTCYVRMTDINNILTIYGQRAHKFNNKEAYVPRLQALPTLLKLVLRHNRAIHTRDFKPRLI